MTIRRPLVLVPNGNPQIQELPSGDSIVGGTIGPVGMTYQGAWNSGTSYNIDDVVTNNGSCWIAIVGSTNQTPPTLPTISNTYWSLLASKGDTGATGATGATGPQGPAGSSGDLVRITETVTSGSQSNVTFSSIPSTYRDLQLKVRGRGTNATTGVDLLIQFNSDTGANYDYEDLHSFSSSTAAAQGVAQTNYRVTGASNCFTANSAPANAAAAAVIDIYDYRGTTFFKTANCRWNSQIGTGATTQGNGISGCVYRSTSAISAIKVFFSAGNFVDGSIVSLYGIN